MGLKPKSHKPQQKSNIVYEYKEEIPQKHKVDIKPYTTFDNGDQYPSRSPTKNIFYTNKNQPNYYLNNTERYNQKKQKNIDFFPRQRKEENKSQYELPSSEIQRINERTQDRKEFLLGLETKNNITRNNFKQLNRELMNVKGFDMGKRRNGTRSKSPLRR